MQKITKQFQTLSDTVKIKSKGTKKLYYERNNWINVKCYKYFSNSSSSNNYP